VLDERGADTAKREITSWPGYAETPLRSLSGLAKAVGVEAIDYKDESERFGLDSFKALGGAYAVYRCLAKEVAARTGVEYVGAKDLAGRKYRQITSEMTVCCATDGNHGRSVAWGARTFGCECVVYVNASVSEGRARAIARYGARVVRNPGSYDDAVRRAAVDAESNHWVVVSDTSYAGYTDIPRDVMHGYTVMVDEAIGGFASDELPTHVFVQGGVGGVAAAVCARFWWQFGRRRPCFVVVEPEGAACLYESAKAGRRVALEGDVSTVMGGLEAAEASLLAWTILSNGADFFVTIPDAAALDVMRLLADGVGGDPPLVAGESGVAGLAGMLAVAHDASLAETMGLDSQSRALVFGTEGDTDPDLYFQIVGRSAQTVRAA
jgi:diaminopropionate ammonia-lyase